MCVRYWVLFPFPLLWLMGPRPEKAEKEIFLFSKSSTSKVLVRPPPSSPPPNVFSADQPILSVHSIFSQRASVRARRTRAGSGPGRGGRRSPSLAYRLGARRASRSRPLVPLRGPWRPCGWSQSARAGGKERTCTVPAAPWSHAPSGGPIDRSVPPPSRVHRHLGPDQGARGRPRGTPESPQRSGPWSLTRPT